MPQAFKIITQEQGQLASYPHQILTLIGVCATAIDRITAANNSSLGIWLAWSNIRA
jgi:hypothetical protein